MNDPEIENFGREASIAASEGCSSAHTDLTQPPVVQEFQNQSAVGLHQQMNMTVETPTPPLPVLVEGESALVEVPSASSASHCLLHLDGFRLLALELNDGREAMSSRNDVPPPPLSLDLDNNNAAHTQPPSPHGGASSGPSSHRHSPVAVLDDELRHMPCKWDGVTEGRAGSPDGSWHSVFEDVQAPLWAEQLAAAQLPERLLRYVIGTQAVLRDWRASYLVLRYGKRLGWTAATNDVAEQASTFISNLRIPKTEDGRRRLLRLQSTLPGLDEWLQDLRDVVEGGVITGVVLAAACTCVWTKVLQPLVPPWVVAACVVEWLSTVLSTPDTRTGNAALDGPVSDPSARLVLFEMVDVLCVTRQAAEAIAFVSAARQACRSVRSMPDEHAWVQVSLNRLLWGGESTMQPWRPREAGDPTESPSEREEESLSSLAPTSASATDVLETVVPTSKPSNNAAATVWSWGMPIPVDTSVAASEMPCVWVEYPPAMSSRIEEAAQQAGFQGCHTLVVDDVGRQVSDCLLFLEDEVHFDTMTVFRGGVKLNLRRHGPPSTVVSVAENVTAQAVTSPLEAGDSSSPSDPLALLEAIESRVLRVYPPVATDTPSTALTSAVEEDQVPPVTGGEEGLDWGNQGPRPSMYAQTMGGEKKPWHAKVDLRPVRRSWAERTEHMIGVKPPQAVDAGVSHVLSGCIVKDRLHRLPRINVDKQRSPHNVTAAKLCAGAHINTRQEDMVFMRYRDGHCDMVVTTSVIELLTLLGDERPSVQGATLYISTTAEDTVPERVLLEQFDRNAEDASSDDDDPRLTAPGTRRGYTFDVMLQHCSRLCESVVRRLALRSGCVNLVRCLVDVARRSIVHLAYPGTFVDCVCADGDHVTITIGVPPTLGVGLASSTPVSEILGIARAPSTPVAIGHVPNSTAALQAHIRSLTPDFAKGSACSGVPLGGWKAHPAGTRLHRNHRNRAGVDIPPAVPPSTALVSHLPAVTRTTFGIKPFLSQNSQEAASPNTSGLLLGNVMMMNDGIQQHNTNVNPLALTVRDMTQSRVVAEAYQPAETLGAHPRHPGATTEWAFLSSVKRRAAASGREDFLLSRLRKHADHLPVAPEDHALSTNSLEQDLRRVVRRRAEATKSTTSSTATNRPPSGDAVPPADPTQVLPLAFKLRS